VDNSTETETATAQIEETWNAILAPLARRAGGERHTGNWLNWCKRQMGHGVSVERLEARLGGLCELRDRGVFDEWIPRGAPCTPAVFERVPQLREQCDAAWSTYGPSKAGSIISGLGVTL